MRLLLLHGRRNPDEELDDWGPDGPVILHVEWVHVTYMGMITVGFDALSQYENARKVTGWEEWDEQVLRMPVEECLIKTTDENGMSMWYGDWELQE